MKQTIRYVIVLLVFLSIIFLAGNPALGAGSPAPVGNNAPAVLNGVELVPEPQGQQGQPGTVRPPPADATICEDGVASVGGASTLEVSSLAEGFCLAAFLRDRGFAVGRIPDGAGEVLAPITFLRVFSDGSLVSEADGDVQICYAVPVGTDPQIYFFDFYGPRLGGRTGQPSWEPVETTVENGVACATAERSGAYALIG